MGLPQVLTDPRTNFAQCLQAVLIAELVDNDGWVLLSELAETMGHGELGKQFGVALAEEEEHLAMVRTWVTTSTLQDAARAS